MFKSFSETEISQLFATLNLLKSFILYAGWSKKFCGMEIQINTDPFGLIELLIVNSFFMLSVRKITAYKMKKKNCC